MEREEGEGLRRDGWIRFGRIAKRWVSEAYKMQHWSPRTENAGEDSWMSCQYMLWHRHGIKSKSSRSVTIDRLVGDRKFQWRLSG